MRVETGKFILQEPKNSSTIKVFDEVVKIKDKETVQIFGLLESGHPDQHILLDHTIGQCRYFFEKLSLIDKKPKIGEVFEQTLQELNHELTSFIKNRNILVDFECLGGIIAVLWQHEIYFTYLGTVTSLLIHKSGKDSYKIIEILDNVSGSAIKPTVFKIFSNVISGQVQDQDALFFGSSNITNFIDKEKIRQLIVDNETEEALQKIQSLLQPDQSTSFGAVLLKLNPQKKENKAVATKSLLPKILRKQEEVAPVQQFVEKEEVEVEDDNTVAVEESLPEVEAEFFESEQIVDDTVEEEPADDDFEEEKNNPVISKYSDGIIKQKVESSKKSNFSFKFLSKIFFLIFLVAIALFFYNLKNKQTQNLSKIKNENDLKQIQIIEAGLVNIDSQLIINQNDKALELINQTRELVGKLSANQKDFKQKTIKQLGVYLDKINKVINLSEPAVLVELANPVSNLIKDKNFIYLYNSSNSLYQFNLDNQQIKAVATEMSDKGSWQKNAPDFEEGKALLLYNGSGLSQYDFTSNDLTNIDISLASGAIINDLNFYGQKLYLLDGKNGKIYKHVKVNKNSFNSGSSWVTDSTDLTGAVSMSIDSNIWVLKNSGEIIRLFKNQKVDWQIKTINPPLSSPTKIYTSLEMENLYILEPATKRLVVIDKLGNLLKQITSEKFDNLLDFVVEKDKTGKETGKVYLLNGLKIFTINVK